MSNERNGKAHSPLFEYLLPMAMLILIALVLIAGFYSLSVERSSSVYTYLAGIAFVFAGVLLKSVFDLFMVRRKEKSERIRLLRDLLMECQRNLELVENKKIHWPQVHFDVVSYKTSKDKTVLSGLPSAIREQIFEVYRLASEIEKRKLRAFDKTTDAMLEKLAEALPKAIEELRKKVPP